MKINTNNEIQLSVNEFVRQNWKKVLLFSIVVSLIVLVYSFIMPHTFSAESMAVVPESKQGAGLSSMLSSVPVLLGGGSQGSQILVLQDILESRTAKEFVIRKLKLDSLSEFAYKPLEDQIDQLGAMFSVEAKKSTNMLYIVSESKTGFFPNEVDDQKAALLSSRIVNTLFEALDSINRRKNFTTARTTREYIEKVLYSNKLRIDSLQTEIVKFQKKSNLISLDEQTKSLVASSSAIGSELAKAEIELNVAKNQFNGNSAYIQTLESKVASLKQQFSDSQQGGLLSGDALSLSVEKVPDYGIEYISKMRDYKILEQVNAYLETQRMQESIQEHRDVSSVQIIDAAVVPQKRSAPRRGIMLIIAFFGTAIISTLYFFSKEIYKQ